MYFHYDAIDEDNDKLVKFLRDVQSFLDRLVQHKRAFAADIYDTVASAWGKAKNRFDTAIQKTTNIAVEKLDSRGLTGEELKLKLRNVENAFGDLLTQFGGQSLLRLFDVIDTLLKSLADAVGVGTALEEIKDAIKGALIWART